METNVHLKGMSPQAQNLYNQYKAKTFQTIQLDGGATIQGNNPYAMMYLNAIFESAAGSNGFLSDKAAEVVKQFLESEASKVNLKALGPSQARQLANDWQVYAGGHLPQISNANDIATEFGSLSNELDAALASGSPDQYSAVLVKISVFFNQLIAAKEKGKLSEEGMRNIIKGVNNLFGRDSVKNTMFGNQKALGEQCIIMLNNVAGPKEGNNFIDKYFPNSPYFKKCNCD